MTKGSNLPHHPEWLDRLAVITAAASDAGLATGHKEMAQHLSPEMFAGTPIVSQYQALSPAPDFPALVEKIKQLELTPPAWPETPISILFRPRGHCAHPDCRHERLCRTVSQDSLALLFDLARWVS